MQEISDPKRIERWLDRESVLADFDTRGLRFRAVQYEKKELLSAPDKPQDKLLFLIRGSVQVYGIRADGTLSPVNSITAPALLGDVEFCGVGEDRFFVEAKTRVTCLALPLAEYKPILEQDVRFLHLVLRSLAAKLELFSALDAMPATIRERVLHYMREICPRGELRGVETATLRLRCSRRQLQRALRGLCEEGLVQKTGKGRYRLV